MKLLQVSSARALWFMHLNDLNPRGRSSNRNVMPEVVKRYNFAKSPTPVEIVEAGQKNQPMTLSGGLFKNAKGDEMEVSLMIYRDALFGDTRSSTDDSEAFLTDLMDWLVPTFGLLDYKALAIRKIYVSEVYVSLDKSLNMIHPKFAEFAKLLQKHTKTLAKPLTFEAGSIQFWIDPDIKHVHVPFRLERQADVGFAENRYYSIAPLETEEHLKAIAALEKLLAA